MLQTPLNAWHHAHHGRMVDFAGWEMPVQYSSIVEEHNAVRSSVGLFDISHMGRLEFHGKNADEFLNSVLTNDASRLRIGDIRYSLVCRPDGGILDDVLLYRLADRWLLVVNASNREKIVSWLQQQPGFATAELRDLTLSTAMLAIQGPKAVELMKSITDADINSLKYYSGTDLRLADVPTLISRTGYTGEDGFELIVPASEGVAVWQKLMQHGAALGIMSAGLGCRDTLRLEAGMPLYGHELSESIDPLSAGLSFAVRMQKSAFIGKESLANIQSAGLNQVRVALLLQGRRIARENALVLTDGQIIGQVTSGTFSPTLQQSIAMAYVTSAHSQEGSQLQVDLRGTMVAAQIVPLPFYKRPVSAPSN